MSSDSVKRIMAEVRELGELNKDPSSFFHAEPMESDLFEWHFTVRGPPDTPFESGLYHGRILLPPEYPLKAPEIILLTPNGRFEVGKRICLSVTSHHDETWQPSWGIRTILTALVGFMPSKSHGLGALDYPAEDRRALARKSRSFCCPRCGAKPAEQFPSVVASARPGPSSASDRSSPSTSGSTSGASLKLESADGSPADLSPRTNGDGASSALSLEAVEPAQSAESGRPAVERETDASEASQAESASRPERSTSPASSPAVRGRQSSRGARRASRQSRQETELYYLAVAIAFAILAIITRRVMRLLS